MSQEIKCKTCKKKIFIPNFLVGKRYFCSRSCRRLSTEHKQKLSILHTKEKIKKVCLTCGKEWFVSPSHNFRKFCCRKCKRLSLESRKKISNIQGGRSFDKYGYKLVYYPMHPYKDRRYCVREHRLIVENILKRYLIPREVIHHINGKKDDNQIDNLQYFRHNAAHLRFESFIKRHNLNPLLVGEIDWRKIYTE